ncbi:hypothetical protein ACXZ66_08435 [Corynebacterium sp. S7]
MTNPPNNGYPYNPDDDAEANQYQWERYGQSDYYSYGTGPGGQHNPQDQQAMVNTNGMIDVFRAVAWAFPTLFSNAVVWILGTVITGVILLVVMPLGMALTGNGTAQTPVIFDIVIGLLGVALSIFLLRGAIWQVDKRKISYRDLITDVNVWPALATSVLSSLLLLVITGGLALLIGGDQALALMGFSNTPIANPADITGRAILGVFIAGVAGVLVRPLLAYAVHFIVERRATSIGQTFVFAYEAGRRNYLRLLGFNIVAGVLAMTVIVLTFGVGAIIVLPALILIDAHMYRQAAGGPIPWDSERDGNPNQGPQNPNYNGFL